MNTLWNNPIQVCIAYFNIMFVCSSNGFNAKALPYLLRVHGTRRVSSFSVLTLSTPLKLISNLLNCTFQQLSLKNCLSSILQAKASFMRRSRHQSYQPSTTLVLTALPIDCLRYGSSFWWKGNWQFNPGCSGGTGSVHILLHLLAIYYRCVSTSYGQRQWL